MDCLYAECTPMMTDCVMAELEKLGAKYRVALKVAKVWFCCPLALPTLLVLVSMSASMCKPFYLLALRGTAPVPEPCGYHTASCLRTTELALLMHLVCSLSSAGVCAPPACTMPFRGYTVC